MKKFLILLIFIIVAPYRLQGGDDEVNVMSYYAVDNSLDGQPMIDKVNVLRFFPVFAMRDSTDIVRVTIYYGGNIYSRLADKMDGGRYWQVLLPKFRLGEAIQRIEVEVHFCLKRWFTSRYNINLPLEGNQKRIKEINNLLSFGKKEFQQKKTEFAKEIIKSNKIFEELGLEKNVNNLRKLYEKNIESYFTLRDSFLNLLLSKNKSYNTNYIDSLVALRSQLLSEYLSNFKSYKLYKENLRNERDELLDEEDRKASNRDSLISALAEEIQAGLIDTMYSGPSVRKSDIIIDKNFSGARILYRNYKGSLRRMQAADPAERIGIFRVRYVPFPITGTKDNSKMHRIPFSGNNSKTVFEIGLAFGDMIVPGDQFVKPELSINRFGIAFAITEKLFDEEAEIIALVITYDFNSYGSIGYGRNFAKNGMSNYMSFGINKKAFEAVLGSLSKLFMQ